MKFYRIAGEYHPSQGMGWAAKDKETAQSWVDRYIKYHPEAKPRVVEVDETPSLLTFFVLY
jgi:hypothetical protein